jgi:hypothetical protein
MRALRNSELIKMLTFTDVKLNFETMKKLVLTLVLLILCFSFRLFAPVSPPVIFISEPIHPYEALWAAVCQIESGGNVMAIGDKHLKKHSYGIVQIRQSRLDDYAKRTGIHYTVKDCFDKKISKSIFMYYAVSDYETCARMWNGGTEGMNKKSTIKYWKLVKSNL